MNNIKYIITTFSILLVLFSSCGHKHNEGDGHNHGTEENTHSESDEHNHGEGEEEHKEGLFLSKDQAETIGLELSLIHI